MKHGRQRAILEIISQRDIETQGQLMEALKERGISSTQATLSRDIKDMRLVKELAPNGGYRYVSPTVQEKDDHNPRFRAVFRKSVLSYDIAQNLIVIKTPPGLAPICCSAFDGMEVNGLVGTIAGDDTAFIAMRDNEAANRLYHEIEKLF